MFKKIISCIIGTTTPPVTNPINTGFSVPQRDWDYLLEDQTPESGPALSTVYVPGTRGGVWTDHEVASTRRRVLQMIHPNWGVQEKMGTWVGVGTSTEKVKEKTRRSLKGCMMSFLPSVTISHKMCQIQMSDGDVPVFQMFHYITSHIRAK